MRRSARRDVKGNCEEGQRSGEAEEQRTGEAEVSTGFRRRPGKEHVVDERTAVEGPDERLPLRLFETDRFPSRRLNNYSTLGYLLVVREALKGTPDFGRLLRSCFGPLFNIPVRRCSFSSVILHAMLVRQVMSKKRYELWPVFGGNPLRFSLVEFGRVTGLPCGEFKRGYSVEFQPKYKEDDYAFWDYLFDGRRDITIAEVAKMVEEDLTIFRSRKFRLCLILIVDGVLLASTSPVCPTAKHVKRLENLSKFLEFPWGRESFYWTISTMIPPKMVMGVCDDPEGEFCSSLRQQTKKMSGFPLALQLVVYEAIPLLSARLGGSDDLKIIDCETLPQRKGLKVWDVLEAEHHPELMVQPMMEEPDDAPEGWDVWDDEIGDKTISYMVARITAGHKYKKTSWRGGDAQEVLYKHEDAKVARKRKREAGAGKKRTVAGPALKQRRLSAYFRKPSLVDNEDDTGLLLRVEALEKTVVWLRRKLSKRRKVVLTPRKDLLRSGKFLKKKKKKEMSIGTKDDLSNEDEEEEDDGPVDGGFEERKEDDSDDEGDGSDKGASKRSASDDDWLGKEDVNEGTERSLGKELDDDVNVGHVDGGGIEKETDCIRSTSAPIDEVAETDDSAKEEVSSANEEPPVLVPLAKGDGAPLQWVEKGVSGVHGNVLYRATTSQTYYVAESIGDEIESVGGGSHEESVRLDKLIGKLVKDNCATEVVFEDAAEKTEAVVGDTDMAENAVHEEVVFENKIGAVLDSPDGNKSKLIDPITGGGGGGDVFG